MIELNDKWSIESELNACLWLKLDAADGGKTEQAAKVTIQFNTILFNKILFNQCADSVSSSFQRNQMPWIWMARRQRALPGLPLVAVGDVTSSTDQLAHSSIQIISRLQQRSTAIDLWQYSMRDLRNAINFEWINCNWIGHFGKWHWRRFSSRLYLIRKCD